MATDTRRLATLITAKLQVLEVLARLARRQMELIEAAELTAHLKLLAAKQSVMTQLQTIENELMPFRGEDPDQRIWPSPADRAACQSQAERCNALLNEVMQLEIQAEAAMVRRRDAAAATIAEVESASVARFAYVASASPAAATELEG